MDSAQALIAVVVVALTLVAGGVTVSYASTDAGETNPTVETVNTGANGSTVLLNQSGIDSAVYSDTAGVVNGSSVNMVEGQDYEWNSTDGTLTVTSQRLANGTATVSYNYRVPSETETGVVEVIGYVIDSGAYIPLILMVGTLVLGVAAFGGVRG